MEKEEEEEDEDEDEFMGGHDDPSWGILKRTRIVLP